MYTISLIGKQTIYLIFKKDQTVKRQMNTTKKSISLNKIKILLLKYLGIQN